jgi:hypothetical protein
LFSGKTLTLDASNLYRIVPMKMRKIIGAQIAKKVKDYFWKKPKVILGLSS